MQSTNCADKLNGMLKKEMAAVETYNQALEKITDPSIRAELENVQQSHMDRSAKLTAAVSSLGKEPATGSGAWGAFARLVAGGAQLFGDKAAIAVLEEGEDKELSDYKRLVNNEDPSVASIVDELLPRQEVTHEKISALKRRLEDKGCCP